MRMNDTEYLEKRLKEQQKYHSKQAKKYKQRYYGLNATILIVSAAIPIITLCMDSFPFAIRIVTAILSSLITILTGLLSLFKYQELWVTYRTTSELLKKNEFLYETKTFPYNQENAFELLVLNCEEVIGNITQTWEKSILSERYNIKRARM